MSREWLKKMAALEDEWGDCTVGDPSTAMDLDALMKEMTDKERNDLLVNLMEEACEIGQAASKWVRFGADSYDPSDELRIPNSVALSREIGNLLAIAIILGGDNMICDHEIQMGIDIKMQKLKKYGYI